jgi:hypothetical protein
MSRTDVTKNQKGISTVGILLHELYPMKPSISAVTVLKN